MKITRSELLDVVYRFYPRGLHNFSRIHAPPNEPFYDDTEEHLRLVEAANRGRAEYPTWKAMTRRLGDRYSLHNESIRLLAGWVDPAYSASIYGHGVLRFSSRRARGPRSPRQARRGGAGSRSGPCRGARRADPDRAPRAHDPEYRRRAG